MSFEVSKVKLLLNDFIRPRQTFGGIIRPISLAAFRLMMNSNFFGCSTGRSAGLAPFKILSTYVAARRYKSGMFAP